MDDAVAYVGQLFRGGEHLAPRVQLTGSRNGAMLRRADLSIAPRFLRERLSEVTVSWFPFPATVTRTMCAPPFGVYGRVAVKPLTWLMRAIQGWTAILGPWVVGVPRTFKENWTAIFLVAVKMVVIILVCWALLWKSRFAVRSWHRAVQLLGLPAAVHGARVIIRLRYREPFRYMRANAPGLSMTFPALLAVIVFSEQWLSWFSISLLVLVALWQGVVWP